MYGKELIVIGANSKVLKGIEKTQYFKGINTKKISIREGMVDCVESCNIGVLYLSSITDTYFAENNLAELIKVNCLDLCEFIKTNKNCIEIPFLYISSVKCCGIKKCFEVKKLAQQIIQNVENNSIYMDEIVSRFESLLNDPYDSYALSKLLAEQIVLLLCKKSLIIRSDYLIGSEENENEIYKMINGIFNNSEVSIPLKNRGFVTYKDLSQIIVFCLDNIDSMKSEVLNLFGQIQIGPEEMHRIAQDFISIVHSESTISFREKGYETVPENNNFSDIYRKIMNKDFTFSNVWDEIYQIFYRSFINKKLQYKILDEYIGGSYAKVYKTKKDGEYFSIKIAYGEGADNGAEKIQNEVRQLGAVEKYYNSEGIETTLLPDKVKEVCSMPRFTYVISKWKDGELLYDKVERGENVQKTIKDIIYEIDACYRLRTVECSKDLLVLNRDRIEYRINMMEMLDDNLSEFLEASQVNINNSVYDGPRVIVERLSNKYDSIFEKWGLCISGDAIFDNFIIDDENNMIQAFDPRGVDLLWETDGLPYFYPMYDWAKMIFYFLGWKIIREDCFDLSVNNKTWIFNYDIDKSCSKARELVELSDDTFYILNDLIYVNNKSDKYMKEVLFLMGVHFLCDAFPRLCGKGNSKKQCYAELLLGTIVLNVIDKNYEKGSNMIWNEILCSVQKMLFV